MSTGSLQFFSRPNEFLDILAEVVASLNLHVIMQRFRRKPAFVYLGQEIDNEAVARFAADRIYIADRKPDIESVDERDFIPAVLGWVQIDLPKEFDGKLLLGVLGVKSDWYDPKTGETYENREVFNLYKKIRSRLRRKFRFPVWAYNINSLKSATYRDIGYEDSAREFTEKGGELMQEGVKNVRFTLEEPIFN